MKIHTALVYLAVSFALAGTPAPAATAVPTSSTSKKAAVLKKELSTAAPASLSAHGPTVDRHLFPVNDERGLLLTCVAPEIEVNKDTDVFKDCTLAPGRTLDDVMHSFIQAIHQQQAAQEPPAKNPEAKPDEKAEQK